MEENPSVLHTDRFKQCQKFTFLGCPGISSSNSVKIAD